MHTTSFIVLSLFLTQLPPGEVPVIQPTPLGVQPLQPIPLSSPLPADGQPTPAKAPLGETPRAVAPATPVEPPAPANVSSSTAPTEPGQFVPPSQPTADVPQDSATLTTEQPSVIQTTAEQPLWNTGQQNANSLPKGLLLAALNAPRPEWLAKSKPTTLTEALSGATNQSRQQEIVQAYWNASLALADYVHALQEVAELQDVAVADHPQQQALLQAAQAAAVARASEAELSLVASQHDLVQSTSLALTDALPLPTDAPLVGPYRTEYDALAAHRPLPVQLRKIDETLPLLLKLIRARATAVAAGVNSFDQQVQAYERGELDLQAVLDSHLHLRDQRIAFLAAVRDYNNSIAAYALAVASPNATSDGLVQMLIETHPLTKSVLVPDSRVVPATLEQPAAQPPSIQSGASPTRLVPVAPPADGFVPRRTTIPANGAQPPAIILLDE